MAKGHSIFADNPTAGTLGRQLSATSILQNFFRRLLGFFLSIVQTGCLVGIRFLVDSGPIWPAIHNSCTQIWHRNLLISTDSG